MDTLQELIDKVKELEKKADYKSIDELLTDEVLQVNNSAQLYLYKAAIFNINQDGHNAYNFAQRAIELTSENMKGYYERGYASFYIGDFQNALDDFNVALSVYKRNADVFFLMGQCWYKLGDFRNAINAFSKAIQLNSPDYTLHAYYNRGLSKNALQEYSAAIEDFDQVINTQNDYYQAYCDKGIALFMLENNDDALINYNLSLLYNSVYPVALYDRGLLHHVKKEYGEALADYSAAIEYGQQQRSFITSIAYNNRGNLRMVKEEYKEALDDFNSSLLQDPQQAEAYLNRGMILQQQQNYIDARRDFMEAMYLFKFNSVQYKTYLNFLEEQLKLVDEKISDNEKLSKIDASDDDKKQFAAIVKMLDEEIDSISKAVRQEEKAVVHYTKLFVADIYAKTSASKINYSNAIYMNDPNEGKILMKYLDNPDIKMAFENGEKSSELSVYIGSFLPAENGEAEPGHNDELIMWRTYGRDGDGNEACGCSIIIDSDFFKTPVSMNKQVVGETADVLSKVIYINERTKERKMLTEKESGIEDAVSKFKDQLLKLITLKNLYKADHKFSIMIDKFVYKKYSKIAYLFKSADYEYENEVRVMKYVPRNSDTIKFYPPENKSKPGKLYVESVNPVLPYVLKIYLGPKVQDSPNWSLYLDYQIKQRQNEYKLIKMPEHKFKVAAIEIIKSKSEFV